MHDAVNTWINCSFFILITDKDGMHARLRVFLRTANEHLFPETPRDPKNEPSSLVA